MKTLSEYSANVLSKLEMKSITGGNYWNCHCTTGVGSWTGYYTTPQQALNAVANWCLEGAGHCLQNG